MKTLIIRTDRLGDFYFTIPYINCLKRVYGKSNVDIVVKKHIYPHIKKKKYLYNKIYSFPGKSVFSKIYLGMKLRKERYKQLIIFDGKDRSLILSKFLNVPNIYHTYPKKKKNFITNFLFTNKYTTFFDDHVMPIKLLYKRILSRLNIKIVKNDFKILLYKNIKQIKFFKSKNISINKYVHIHVDEKWFSDSYIKEFTNISPNISDFYLFIKKLIKIKKTNLIITTGTIKLPFIKKLSDKYFNHLYDGYFSLIVGKFKVFLLKKVPIDKLEIITMNANTVVTCHGPLTQIAGSFNINLIDIIDKTHEKWYFRHTSHIKKYNRLYREDFNQLLKKILLKIK